MRYTPADIAHLLGQKFSPTPEQAAVISSSPGPSLLWLVQAQEKLKQWPLE